MALMRKLLSLTTLLITSFGILSGETDDSLYFKNSVFSDNIKTVQLYKEGWNLSYPVIKLKSEDKLVLNFDLLGDQIENYYYTFIHCTKDWKRSDIFTGSYLEGFPENQIEDYRSSFNTTVNYIHYRLIFPNDRISLNLSGNYILFVYPADEPDKAVITQRFVVSEDAVSITTGVRRPMMANANNTSQQIDFTVNYSGLNLNDPYMNIYSFILQNGRWDNAKRNLKPDFQGNNELRYSTLSDKNIFTGGNEFRWFDIKSIRYLSQYVKSIDFLISNYNVFLQPSENREFKPYFYWQDFNGKYYIAYQEGQNPDTDADYVYVWFTLPSGYPVTGGKIYVSGAFNQWRLGKNNMMIYNTEKEAYECSILLKQGWYNFEYVFVEEGKSGGTASKFEGDHYETENDYSVVVYYRNPRERYDRVIGTSTVNTLNRITD